MSFHSANIFAYPLHAKLCYWYTNSTHMNHFKTLLSKAIQPLCGNKQCHWTQTWWGMCRHWSEWTQWLFVNFALWCRKQGKEDEHIIRILSLIHSFIHSLNKYLLQAYPEPGTILDIGGGEEKECDFTNKFIFTGEYKNK